MKIVIAIDSFKGSLSSREAGEAAARGAAAACPEAEISVFAVSDGGEGLLQALAGACSGLVGCRVTGPLGEPVDASYGVMDTPGGKAAVIEMAQACGLPLVPPPLRDPLATTSFGFGELIRDAFGRGCRKFFLGIGGSATNDCGLGMLTALGARFHGAGGNPAGITGQALRDVASADPGGLLPGLRDCEFRVACDVTNPLCGPEGCSAMFGPQKGGTPEALREMDAWIGRFAALAPRPGPGPDTPGAGAAGGVGFALCAWLGAELLPGLEAVIEAAGIRPGLRGADLVLTGEGRLDAQSLRGKVPSGIARAAKLAAPGAAVVALCGAVGEGARAVNSAGIDAFFPVIRRPMPEAEAMRRETASAALEEASCQAVRLFLAGKSHAF